MTCEAVEPELVAYHFGTLDGEPRDRVEAHLVTCPRCVATVIALKRAIENEATAVRPSPAVRARLRRAVAGELGIAPAAAPKRRFWERPLAFAIAASAVLAAGAATRAVASAPATPPHGIDRVVREK